MEKGGARRAGPKLSQPGSEYLRMLRKSPLMPITQLDQLDLEAQYSYADYLSWRLEEAVELIRGRVFRISPSPGLRHQRVSRRLLTLIEAHAGGGPCELFHAPFDVRLPLPPHLVTEDKIHTVVQPDLCVICDPKKLDSRGCLGAPDWIIEILSPGTSRKDFRDKFEVYEHAGVKEYWIVHPHDETVLTYRLNADGRYEGLQRPYLAGDMVPVGLFSDWRVDLGRGFSGETLRLFFLFPFCLYPHALRPVRLPGAAPSKPNRSPPFVSSSLFDILTASLLPLFPLLKAQFEIPASHFPAAGRRCGRGGGFGGLARIRGNRVRRGSRPNGRGGG